MTEAAEITPTVTRRDWSRLRAKAVPLTLHASVLAIWEIACHTVIPAIFLPPPSAIALAFVQTLKSGELPRQLGQTMAVLSVGFALAVIVGMALGILMGTVRIVAKALDPYVNAFYAMPTVALVPLVIIWLGLGFEAKVFLTWIVGVFPIVISAQTGVSNIPASYLETARSFGCSRSQMFWKVMLPAAIPFFVAGLRLGLGRALVGVVVAEMFTALSGLGYMVTFYGNTFKTALLFVPIITLAALSIVVTDIIRRIERRMAPWIERS
jgi:ABC-type nitrate/sulfonate/bicarbonate transport system permease component